MPGTTNVGTVGTLVCRFRRSDQLIDLWQDRYNWQGRGAVPAGRGSILASVQPPHGEGEHFAAAMRPVNDACVAQGAAASNLAEVIYVPSETSPAASPTPLPDFAKGGGLLPVIAQDASTGDVLMLAYMNPESFAETVATGRAVYFSRSKNRLWRKGEESGHVQQVRAILVDCDADTILLKVDQQGPACHEGYRSCFFRELSADGTKVVLNRLADPADIYGRK